MKTIRVAAAVILRDQKIFAAERGYGSHLGWEFPGGKIRENETGEEAIVREIREELSAHITPYRKLMTLEHDYNDFHLSMDVFVCTLSGSEPVLSEHLRAGWFACEALDEVAWLEADRKIIPVLKEYLQQENL